MIGADAAFRQFHRDNPRVMDLFIRYAREAKATGRRRYSIWAIANRVRWHVDIDTHGDKFKINNNWLAYYTREIERRCPELRGFIAKRASRADLPRQGQLFGGAA